MLIGTFTRTFTRTFTHTLARVTITSQFET